MIGLLALELVSLAQQFGFNSPDQSSWAQFSILLNTSNAGFVASVQIALALVAAYMLMPREQDDRTVEFLWALPALRSQFIVLKWLTAFGLMAAFCVIDQLISAWVASFNDNSITSGQFRWSSWWIELMMIWGVTAVGLCYGMLISFFRLAGVVTAAFLWSVTAIYGAFDPTLAYLNPQTLLSVEHFGTEPILAADAWLFHGSVAFASLVLALRLWTAHADAYADWRRRFLAKPSGKAALAVAGVVGVVVLGGLAIGAVNLFGNQPVGATDSASNVQDTAHYRFHFAAVDRTDAMALSQQADAIYARVRDLLGARDTGRIVADLTDTSPQHLGIAGWKKVRIKRNVLYDPATRAHVLAHETTHVLAATESRRRLSLQGNAAGFFSEGIAEWVSYRTLSHGKRPDYPGLADTQRALRMLAAAAWERFDLEFEDLLYRGAFAARYDDALVYALGEAWVTALADTCGDHMPGEVLRAIGRDDAPQRIGGRRFWEDSLQAAGCDVERVNVELNLMMRALEPATRAIPRLSGGATVSDDALTFTLMLTRPAGPADAPDASSAELAGATVYEVILRVRNSADAAGTAVITRFGRTTAEKPVVLTIPRAAVSGARYQFQFGVRFIPGERPFFERWQTGALR